MTLPGDPFEAALPWRTNMHPAIRVDVTQNFGPRSGEWGRTHPPISRTLEDLPGVRIVDWRKDNSP